LETYNAADENLLLEQNIAHTHVFCTVINDEKANINTAMLAKLLSACKVMSLSNWPSYGDRVEVSGTIAVAISPPVGDYRQSAHPCALR
jgi:trk system potassium uptake protein TrkA